MGAARAVKTPFRNVVLGVDGSRHARRALARLAALVPDPRGRVTAVSVVEPMRSPSLGLLPGAVRGRIAGELARLEAGRRAAADKHLAAAAAELGRAGWTVRRQVRAGVPTAEILAAVEETGADLLVLGARGVTGVDRLLLGSVAEGCLKRAPTAVLIVP